MDHLKSVPWSVNLKKFYCIMISTFFRKDMIISLRGESTPPSCMYLVCKVPASAFPEGPAELRTPILNHCATAYRHIASLFLLYSCQRRWHHHSWRNRQASWNTELWSPSQAYIRHCLRHHSLPDWWPQTIKHIEDQTTRMCSHSSALWPCHTPSWQCK